MNLSTTIEITNTVNVMNLGTTIEIANAVSVMNLNTTIEVVSVMSLNTAIDVTSVVNVKNGNVSSSVVEVEKIDNDLHFYTVLIKSNIKKTLVQTCYDINRKIHIEPNKSKVYAVVTNN